MDNFWDFYYGVFCGFGAFIILGLSVWNYLENKKFEKENPEWPKKWSTYIHSEVSEKWK